MSVQEHEKIVEYYEFECNKLQDKIDYLERELQKLQMKVQFYEQHLNRAGKV